MSRPLAFPNAAVTAVLIAAQAISAARAAANSDEPDTFAIGRPTSPAEGLRSIRVADGFVVDLVASEPQVQDPVSIAWDETGVLYVVEMSDYPLGSRGGRVKRLEDRDGDGHFERATLFVDQLTMPDGVFPWRGGVLVAAAPDILYFRDRDGDGVADERRVLFSGFGEGNPQHRMNGFIWGVDNWIYGANGDSDGQIRSITHPDRPGVSIRRRDFRLRPDDGILEPVAGSSQFGSTFDDWGNRFVCNNSAHIRHVVLLASTVDRNPLIGVASVIQEIAEHGTKGVIFPISRQPARFNDPLDVGRFSAACGIHIYRGDLFPAEYRGNAFVCDAVGNLVHRDVLEPDGVTFVARRGASERDREFLASTDPWCRPVNLATGPDGALYVVDMYRAVIEHPEWIPDSIEKQLDLSAGHDRGRIYRVRPAGKTAPPFTPVGDKSPGELVECLGSSNGWLSDTAQRLLVERRAESVVERLQSMVGDHASAAARLRALYLLDSFGKLDDASVLRSLADGSARVREHAVRLSEPRLKRSSELQAALLRLQNDDDPRVRLQLASALGELDGDEAVAALCGLAERGMADLWCRAVVLQSARRTAGGLLERLLADAAVPPHDAAPERLQLVRQLAYVIAADKDAGRVAALLRTAHAQPETSRPWLAVLAGLADGFERAGRPADWDKLPLGGESARIRAELAERVARLASDSARPTDERGDAIRSLGLAPTDAIADRLIAMFHPREPESIQVAAARTVIELGRADATQALIDRWQTHGPAVRRTVIDGLCRQRDGVKRLLGAIEQGALSPAEFEPAVRARVLNFPDEEIQIQAKRVFAQEVNSDRRRVVQEYRDVLELAGDRSRGEQLFQKNCVQCHTVQRVGKAVGPELVAVRKRDRAALLEDLLYPNAALSPAYTSYVVATRDGRVLSGIVANETATSITLRRADAEEDTIPRDDIDEIRSTAQSLMPDGIEKNLTRQQLADIIEYLKQIQ